MVDETCDKRLDLEEMSARELVERLGSLKDEMDSVMEILNPAIIEVLIPVLTKAFPDEALHIGSWVPVDRIDGGLMEVSFSIADMAFFGQDATGFDLLEQHGFHVFVEGPKLVVRFPIEKVEGPKLVVRFPIEKLDGALGGGGVVGSGSETMDGSDDEMSSLDEVRGRVEKTMESEGGQVGESPLAKVRARLEKARAAKAGNPEVPGRIGSKDEAAPHGISRKMRESLKILSRPRRAPEGFKEGEEQ